jgi:hypothetical protein
MRGAQFACLASFGVCIGLVLTTAGCAGKLLPQLTEVEGQVLLDGEPLPQAIVEFIPELAEFGAQYNSRAITDAEGKFKLVCGKSKEPGAVIGKHRIVIRDYIPSELRGRTEEDQAKLAEYVENLKNRPIPEMFASMGKTPLRIEVTAEQKSYPIWLNSPK